MTRARILICSSCIGARDRDAERQAVRAALKRAGLETQVDVTEHECFSACDAPTSVALQGQAMASYVFAGIDVLADAEDIAATCQTYVNSPAGWIEDARPCGRLRLCLRTRVPAF